jgi:hypothetical protein
MIEQGEGRIIRQGNTNPQVKIFRYVTKSSFDAYNWQLLEQKQKFKGRNSKIKLDVDEKADNKVFLMEKYDVTEAVLPHIQADGGHFFP